MALAALWPAETTAGVGMATEIQSGLSAPERERLLAVIGMLAPRQRQVARLMLAGCSYRRIADDLCLSDSTVRGYIRRIRRIMR